MYYHCAKFGGFGLSRLGFFCADGHTDRITEADERYTVAVSREEHLLCYCLSYLNPLYSQFSPTHSKTKRDNGKTKIKDVEQYRICGH